MLFRRGGKRYRGRSVVVSERKDGPRPRGGWRQPDRKWLIIRGERSWVERGPGRVGRGGAVGVVVVTACVNGGDN